MANQFTVNINLKSNETKWIKIQCLNNSPIQRWFESAKITYQNSAKIEYNQNPALLSYNPQNFIKTNYSTIIQAIETLKKIGIEWPVEEPYEFDFTSDWCNRVHRYFTTLTFTGNRLDFKSSVKFEINVNDIEYVNALHTINNGIHLLENYVYTPQKQKFCKQLEYLKIYPLNFDKPDYYITHPFNRFSSDDFQYHTWEPYTVVFEDEILGKHILRSFFDNDNPNHIDTSGFKGWFGGFKIYKDNTREKIYKSIEFQKWLQDHKLNYNTARADYAIGNVIDSSHSLDDIFKSCKNTLAIDTVTLDFKQ